MVAIYIPPIQFVHHSRAGLPHCAELQIPHSSRQTQHNVGVWSLIELVSLYTVPLSAVNGLSRLTTMSNWQARPIQKFSNRNFQIGPSL